MAAPATLHLHLIRQRIVATDGWCDRCLLPSVATREALVAIGDPPHHDTRMKYLRGRMCVDCGAGGRLYPVEVRDRPERGP